MRFIAKWWPQSQTFDVCPLRRGGRDLGVYLDRTGQGWQSLVGWRIIVPGCYVIVLFRGGRHRRATHGSHRR